MGYIHHSSAVLRFFGDDLIPDQISALLGATATESCIKGETVVGKDPTRERIAKTGSWRLKATREEPENLEAQVFELLEQLTQDLAVWRKLGGQFKMDLFCGIFMGSSNDGLPLSAKALFALGERGISLDLDIYDSSD